MGIKGTAKQSLQSAQTFIERAQQRHLTLAVTGLSRSGKTAFITSLINQLTQGNDAEHLPLFDVVRERRLLSVKQVEQPHFNIAAFRYLSGLKKLSQQPPAWPEATRSISEIRLQVNYRKSKDSLFGKDSNRLLLDIVDYPGEWLLDLPMMKLDFQQWSEQQWHLLEREPRKARSTQWCQAVLELSGRELDDEIIHELSHDYARLLKHYKNDLGLSLLQPGRMLMPGDLEGTPALAFFPLPQQMLLDEPEAKRLWQLLESRYNYYVKNVVGGFYRDHFSRFDQQVILVDCLSPLNEGELHFREMQQALAQVIESFRYGQQSWLSKLIKPKIERVLVAATKADHVTVEQFSNLTNLLGELVKGAQLFVESHEVTMQSQALASIRTTRFGHVNHQGKRTPAIKGQRLIDGKSITVFPGQVPAKLPNSEYFQQHGFKFLEFAPQPRSSEYEALPHIGMDKAMQFLFGDTLK
ncbi:YcjX family protein [Echinimonas agarilytica]|uniref:YcjX family protein n=1 Tax=Echinimonas agarilytica TaxID=1215918 RepID=A0AA41W7L1_9GAMM|nr:YcjX family protein [Echinimonas agarilytica]MCM2680016.1 YcjX family protein [Echinimonas agarilytica]